eukprot:TRINITY_DN101756_c0_g1_i1.p1 TRINITY_DN101756_c0_g1~~TRINITY_DN101756_c0_g1_i1.p1  ORF type:complete len:326 (-),score=36.41 TRINITY_DN101756_c0_g1_i1:16-993(-)
MLATFLPSWFETTVFVKHRSFRALAVACALAAGWVNDNVHALAVVVRYAVFAAASGPQVQRQLEFLTGSVCTVEKWLRPLLEQRGANVSYIVYTDKQTTAATKVWRQTWARYGGLPLRHVRILNTAAGALGRLLRTQLAVLREALPEVDFAAFDYTSTASIRRFIADTLALPAAQGKLLLGSDFSFLKAPQELADHILSKHEGNFAAYMGFYGAKETRVPWYEGQQCPGIVNDMVFLGQGTTLDRSTAVRMLTEWMKYRSMVSQGGGMEHPGYACDQWTMHMYLGWWTSGNCHMLSDAYKTYGTFPPVLVGDLEGVHEKQVFCTP